MSELFPNSESASSGPWHHWRRLLEAVRVASDFKKLLLAALGLVLLRSGWQGLDWAFHTVGFPIAPVVLTTRPPSPMPMSETIWRVAARMAAEPYWTLVAPFSAMFEVGQGPWRFLHAAAASAWGVLVWGLIGGAITRMAVLQIARDERISIRTALTFSWRKAGPLVGAPLTPMIGVALLAAFCAVFGLLYQLGSIGRSIAGALAFLPLLAGFAMALILLGLAAGWPLMTATVAAQGEDGFDALSRSYSYIQQRPWKYACCAAVAWGLGAVGLLAVGLFVSTLFRLTIWGLTLGAPPGIVSDLFLNRSAQSTPQALHSAWTGLASLLAHGWAYAYFWSAAATIYLLIRQDVDGAAWHDVDHPDPAPVPAPAPPTAPAAPLTPEPGPPA